MNRTRPIVRALGIFAILTSFAIALGGFAILRGNVADLRAAARENILWSALQLELELQRFLGSLAAFRQGSATPEDVNARFDILWSRTTLFQSGSVGDRLSAYDSGHGTIAALFATLQEVEPPVVSLAPGDVAAADAIAARFGDTVQALRLLSRDVLHGEEARDAAGREALLSSATMLIYLSAVALVLSLVMLAVFRRETLQSEATAAENLRLARIAQEANAAKGRFLTTMSHELRTPLNGVVGMLALLRATGLSADQSRFVDQAEASGRRLADLVGHAIDFSDLQDARLVPEPARFALDRLSRDLRDLLSPVAQAAGVGFEMEAAGENAAIGDARLIRQAVGLVALYLAELPRLDRVALRLDLGEAELAATLDCAFTDAPDPRLLQRVLGPDTDDADQFSTEAFGVEIARRLLALLGGSLEVSQSRDRRAVVGLRFPVGAAPGPDATVAVVTSSQALAAMCKAALGPLNLRVVGADAAQEASIVLADTGAGGAAASERANGRACVIVVGAKPSDRIPEGARSCPAEVASIRTMIESCLVRQGEAEVQS